MGRMLFAPLAVLFQLDLPLNLLFVFAGPVIQALAFCALELN